VNAATCEAKNASAACAAIDAAARNGYVGDGAVFHSDRGSNCLSAEFVPYVALSASTWMTHDHRGTGTGRSMLTRPAARPGTDGRRVGTSPSNR
jgi:hypothetical protein